MLTVKKILERKGHEIHSIQPDAAAYEALRIMADKNVGALVVMEGKKLVGIFSERDYARKVILKGKSSKSTPVRDLMTEEVHTVHPDDTVEVCMLHMTDKRIRHLPVLENRSVIGVISIGDVVREIISDQKWTIKHLENYISHG